MRRLATVKICHVDESKVYGAGEAGKSRRSTQAAGSTDQVEAKRAAGGVGGTRRTGELYSAGGEWLGGYAHTQAVQRRQGVDPGPWTSGENHGRRQIHHAVHGTEGAHAFPTVRRHVANVLISEPPYARVKSRAVRAL